MMKKIITSGIVTLGAIALLAGCGSTNTANSSTNTASATSSSVTADQKSQFLNVIAAGVIAIDDFTTGTSTMLGTMDTAKVGGKDVAVVAASQSDLGGLKTQYLDFLSQAQVDALFKNVTKQGGQFVITPVTTTDNLDWYKATVTDIKAQGTDSYQVTLSVPSKDGSAATTTKTELVKKENGHFVYDGAAN